MAVLAFAIVGLMLVFAIPYSVRGPMVEYGRSNGASWNRYKLKKMSRKKLRLHEGGRIAWLVGSSILRDSFDEKLVNRLLEEEGSEYRVRKFGQTRGASALSAGVVRRLPMEPGDLVVHNVAAENFRRDWVDFSELPGWRLQLWLKPHEIWAIQEWSLAERLEEMVAVPRDFYSFHEDHMEGTRLWLTWAIRQGERPEKRTKSYHLTYKKSELIGRLKSARRRGIESSYRVEDADFDLSPEQFNMRGLATLRRAAKHGQAELVLVDIPPRQEYQATFLDEGVRKRWDEWRAEQPELVYFPQQLEDDYYDMKHPNSRGRRSLSRYFVSWLNHRQVGAPTPLHWPPDD